MANRNEPNHICKYSKCDLGVDKNGNKCRKHYYACDGCDKKFNWRSVACCPEHYVKYVEEVEAARVKKPIPEFSQDERAEIWRPDRTDKRKKKMEQEQPIEVEEEAQEESA